MVLKWVYWIAGAACLIYYLAMGFSVRFGLDMSWIWLVAGFALLPAGFSCLIELPMWLRIIWRSVLCLGIVFVIILEGLVISGMHSEAPDGLDYIIVLGAKVNGSTPSRALQHRINAAAEYLQNNPDTLVIASGGQGDDEHISEAECIRNALIEAGIDESRIILEDQSSRTSENMTCSLALLGDADASVGIVTNNFHIYRAMKLAKKAGFMKVSGLAAEYGGITLFHYMIREAAGIAVDFLLGNL